MSETQSAAHANIRCSTILEILGKPKEHVEKTIRDYVQKLRDDDAYVVLSEKFSEAEEQEESKMWSAFVELEMLCKGLESVVRFCFEYMPSSIEIDKPDRMEVSSTITNRTFNDLMARLHKVDMIVKQLKNENDFLRQNLRTSIKNLIAVSLGAAPMTREQLVKATGIGEDQIGPFIEELEKEEKIRNDGERYVLNR